MQTPSPSNPTSPTDRPILGPGATEQTWRPTVGSGARECLGALGVAVLVMAPIFGAGGWRVYGDWRVRHDARVAIIEAALAYERLVAAPPAAMLPVEPTAHGRDLFATVCAACHGASGTGITGLGKSLVESDFVARQSDDELHGFIIEGRPFAEPLPMPPRAGRDDLTDDDLRAIVLYVRGLQDPRRLPELPAMAASAGPTDAQKASAMEAAGGDSELAEYIASGDRLFHSTCVACHGRGGEGVAGNGKALKGNAFVVSLDDDGLFEFITKGRGPTDAANTTGIQMPPKGGNPALSEDDILDIIAYLRTLQPSGGSVSAGH